MVSKLVIAVCILAIIVGPSIVPVAEAGLLDILYNSLPATVTDTLSGLADMADNFSVASYCNGCQWTKGCYDYNAEPTAVCEKEGRSRGAYPETRKCRYNDGTTGVQRLCY